MPLKTRKVFSGWGILFFSIVSFAVLFLIFPQKLLVRRIVQEQHPSPLTIAYLKDLIAKNPENNNYKISLAKIELKMGHLRKAHRLIEPYLLHPMDFKLSQGEQKNLHLLHYRLIRIKTFKLSPKDSQRSQFEKLLEQKLEFMQNMNNLNARQAAYLGRDALALNQPHLAIKFYQIVLDRAEACHLRKKNAMQATCHQMLSVHSYERAAQSAMYVSQYEMSAKFYLLARDQSKGIDLQRKFFIKAVKSLQSSGDVKKALLFAQQNINELREDPATLRYLVRIALKANRPKLAEQYIVLLLKQSGNTLPNNAALAYEVYLLNNHTKAAYDLARLAVAKTSHNPSLKEENHLWRMRLAQVALWEHDPILAARQYFVLAKKFQDQKAFHEGVALSKSMRDDASLIQFLTINFMSHDNKDHSGSELINAWLRLGEPYKALSFLKENRAFFSRRYFLKLHMKIYRVLGEIDKELFFLNQYSDEFQITPKMALQQAEIYMAKGKIKKAEKALILAKASVETFNKKEMLIFWQAYADLAWLTGNEAHELEAYQHLIETHTSEKFYRLISLYSEKNPRIAYLYAKKAMKLFPDNISLNLYAFSLSNQNNSWQDFPQLEAAVSPAIRHLLKFDPAYGEAKANYLQSIGQHDGAVKSFLKVTNDLPTNPYVKSDFLFFLIQTNDLERLAQVLSLWNKRAYFSNYLWGGFAQGYYNLNNPFMSLLALQLFYDNFEKYQYDPYWLIYFKDILESTYHPEASWAVTHSAWFLFLELLTKQKDKPDYTQRLNYVKLSMQEAPGDETRIALAWLQHFVNPDTELLMLSWAFNTGNDALADAIYSYHKMFKIMPPGWAVLSLALRHYDRYLMRELLTNPQATVATYPSKISSYRDSVQAANDIDDISLAQQKAFEALEQHPHDSDLYDHLFTPTFLKTANKLYLSQEYYQYASAVGPRTVSSFTYVPSPSLQIMPYHSIWLSSLLENRTTTFNNNVAISSQDIVNLPAHNERAGVQMTLAQHRGHYVLDMGYRSNLNAFETARLLRQYQVFHDLNLGLEFGYHQLSEDSLGLLVGGMKNDIHLSANYSLTVLDSLLGDYYQNFFYTQDRYSVANGQQATVNYEHRFNQSYPNWTISLYGTEATYFNKTNLLKGSILTLVPPNVPPTVNFLIPINFKEYGVTASFGQQLLDDYTHAWRPFASGTLSSNTAVGFGKIFSIGITGHVFGRDKLLLYYNQGTNQGAGIQIQRLAKISYSLYF